MNEIGITVHGNVVTEPIEREARNQSVFTTFRIASTPFKRTPDGKFVDGETSYFDVISFGPLAANAATALRKGQPVIVQGDLTIRRWSEGERSGKEAQIDARHIGHDLSWGRASFERVSRAVALGADRAGDPLVQAATRGLAGVDDGRPANVDVNGEVHDVEVPAFAAADGALGAPDEGAPDDGAQVSVLGDPDTDDYEAVQLSA